MSVSNRHHSVVHGHDSAANQLFVNASLSAAAEPRDVTPSLIAMIIMGAGMVGFAIGIAGFTSGLVSLVVAASLIAGGALMCVQAADSLMQRIDASARGEEQDCSWVSEVLDQLDSIGHDWLVPQQHRRAVQRWGVEVQTMGQLTREFKRPEIGDSRKLELARQALVHGHTALGHVNRLYAVPTDEASGPLAEALGAIAVQPFMLAVTHGVFQEVLKEMQERLLALRSTSAHRQEASCCLQELNRLLTDSNR